MSNANHIIWQNPLAVIGSLIVILLFTGCGAVEDAGRVDADLSIDVPAAAKSVVQADVAPDGGIEGHYLAIAEESLVRQVAIASDDLPLCSRGDAMPAITRGGAQFVIAHAVAYDGLPDSVPLTIAGNAVTMIGQAGDRQIACSGRLQQGLMALVCEVVVRGQASDCQIVLQRI